MLAALLVLHNLCTAAAPPPHIRVRLHDLRRPASLSVMQNGRVQALEAAGGLLKVGGKPVKKAGFEGPLELVLDGEKARHAGRLEASLEQGRLKLVLESPLEDYALGVAASEILDGRSNTAYVRAMARTVLRYSSLHRGRHKKQGYDFCDSTHCQLYRGLPADEARLRSMLEGLKPLKRGGGFFQRCCGGKLEEETVIWGKAAKGRIISCGYCKHDSFYEWDAEIPHANWLEAASLALGKPVTAFSPSALTPAGRIKKFSALTDGEEEHEIDAWKFYSTFGKRFGWADLHSLWFIANAKGDPVRIKGRGLGHGVGLCQSGALKMAEEGHSEDEILKFYFGDAR